MPLIDTDFGSTFLTNYQTQYDNITETRCAKVHQPTQDYSGLSGVNTGALLMDKTSNYPVLDLPFAEDAVADTTYDVSGQFVIPVTTTASYVVASVRDAGGVIWDARVNSGSYGTAPWLHNFSGTIVVAPGETDLTWNIELYVNTSSGGTGNGDMALTQLTVVAQSSGNRRRRILIAG